MTQPTLAKTTEVDTKLLTDVYRALGAAYDYVNLDDVSDGLRKMDRNHQSSPLASYFERLRYALGDILLGEGEDEPIE